MPKEYIPILLFLLVAISVPVLGLLAGKVIRPGGFFFRASRNPAKLTPYECGVDTEGNARDRYGVRFYIISILFVVFDVETVFLFPWAIIYNKLALFGLIEMLIFLGFLIIGYIYVWQKGALEWV
ncbi:MAG: NADH-quinone oxidoreductase subunit A [Acidobacteria bacterium]|nr:NADH-quinone oxidoreductase subunit A [Acidobacteriota bacterium]MBI3655091.1 NADH-quinone oxidoreductase subunit A [Acidobacteriota bacterium]